MIRFTVHGIPRPKGSLKPVGRRGEKVRMVEQTDVKRWMALVRSAAAPIAHRPMQGPCGAILRFTFERPKSAKNRLFPSVRSTGDMDKLTRAIFDALQPVIDKKTKAVQWPGAIDDDAQIVRLVVGKDYGPTPGVDVLVWELGVDDHAAVVRQDMARFVAPWLPGRHADEEGHQWTSTDSVTLT